MKFLQVQAAREGVASLVKAVRMAATAKMDMKVLSVTRPIAMVFQ
jgi:hypothetical protein